MCFFFVSQGEVYVVEYKGDIYHLPCGDLCASTCLGEGAPPQYDAVGCFHDDKGARVLSHQAAACPEGQEAMSPDVRPRVFVDAVDLPAAIWARSSLDMSLDTPLGMPAR